VLSVFMSLLSFMNFAGITVVSVVLVVFADVAACDTVINEVRLLPGV